MIVLGGYAVYMCGNFEQSCQCLYAYLSQRSPFGLRHMFCSFLHALWMLLEFIRMVVARICKLLRLECFVTICVSLYSVSSCNVNLLLTAGMCRELHVHLQYVSSFWRILGSGFNVWVVKEGLYGKYYVVVGCGGGYGGVFL